MSDLKVEVQALQNLISHVEQRISSLERLINALSDKCNTCNGTGMLYYGSEAVGRSLPEPCDYCNGSGTMLLDVSSILEKFKIEARKEIREELPF